jgi:hypothetical protein
MNDIADNQKHGEKAVRKVEMFASAAIWTAAIAWGSFILFIVIIILPSTFTSQFMQDFDSLGIPVFYLSFLSNTVSFFAGITGLIRSIVRRKEYAGIYRAIIAILLSLALIAIIIPAIHRSEYFSKSILL